MAMAMLPLAALAGLAFLVEGSMETWSAIYLRDDLGAVAFVGALGPAAFHAAMLVGRLIGAAVAGTLGAPSTLLAAGSMTAVGMAVALLVPSPAAAIRAWLWPRSVPRSWCRWWSAWPAAVPGRYAGRAASYVLTLGYAGFLVGPSLVGILGEVAGLRAALVVVPVAAAMIAVASRTRLAHVAR